MEALGTLSGVLESHEEPWGSSRGGGSRDGRCCHILLGVGPAKVWWGQRHTERQRQKDRDRDTETERDRHREKDNEFRAVLSNTTQQALIIYEEIV